MPLLRLLTRYALPAGFLALAAFTAFLATGKRLYHTDGFNLRTPWFFAEVVAEQASYIRVDGKSTRAAGFLHVGMYGARKFANSNPARRSTPAWEFARVSRSGGYSSFDEVKPALTSLFPIATGSADRGGTHFCCGYPQAIGLLVALAAVTAVLLHRRARRRALRQPRSDG